MSYSTMKNLLYYYHYYYYYYSFLKIKILNCENKTPIWPSHCGFAAVGPFCFALCIRLTEAFIRQTKKMKTEQNQHWFGFKLPCGGYRDGIWTASAGCLCLWNANCVYLISIPDMHLVEICLLNCSATDTETGDDIAMFNCVSSSTCILQK